MFSFLRRRISLRKLLPAGIDAHCHLLPGVDDGAPDMETALEIIRTQQALGLRGAICTPHIMARYPDNTPTNLRSVFDSLLDFVNRKSEIVNFRLFLAAEYMLDEAFPRLLEHPDHLLTIPSHLITPASASSPNSTLSTFNFQPSTFAPASQGNTEGKCAPCVNPASASSPNSTLSLSRRSKEGASPNAKTETFNLQLSTSAAADQNYILVELPQYLLPEGWLDVLDSIRACGLRPLLAHPERYLRLLSESDLADLHARGLRYQGNLGSLAGIYGPQVQRLARRLHKSGLYTTFGTDAHSPGMITKMDLAA